MDAYYTRRLLAVVLICSVALTGMCLVSLSSAETGVPGMAVISPDVTIRQGNGVNYTFLESTVLSKLEVGQTFIEIDDAVRFGAEVAGVGHVQIVLRYWNPDADSGQVLQWSASSSDEVTVSFSVYSPSFVLDRTYQVKVDGVAAGNIKLDASRTVSISWSVWSGDHLFELLIPAATEETDDTSDDSDSTMPTRPPATPVVEGLNPVAWLVLGLITTTVVIVAIMLSSSRRNRGRSRT